MNTDLLRQQQQWKEGLKDIRNVMNQVEGQVCRFIVLSVKRAQVCKYITLIHIYVTRYNQFLMSISNGIVSRNF
jgi:hypothetical protein